MPEFSSLPTGCTLRSAKVTDKPSIQRMLTNLERELAPPDPRLQLIWRTAILTLMGLVLVYVLLVPGIKDLLKWLLGPTMLLGVVCVIALYMAWEREWCHYWVLEYHDQVIGCAKLQCQGAYSVLYDVYITPDWRGQGLGSYLVQFLGQQARRPLYLACLPARLAFYTRLGFSPVHPRKLSPLLQYDLGLLSRSGIIPLVLV